MEENQKYALITGGSSGIGMELSKLLAKDGYILIIVAKPQEELDHAKEWFDEHMPEVNIIYRAQDLTVQHRYFEIPRRINSQKIATHFKISRSALNDHLRKIERVLYNSIFN